MLLHSEIFRIWAPRRGFFKPILDFHRLNNCWVLYVTWPAGQGPIVLNSILSTIYSFYYLKYSALICPQHSLTQSLPEFFEVPKAKTSHPQISQTKNPRTFFFGQKKNIITSDICRMPDLTHHLQHHGGIEQHFDLRPGHPDGGDTSSKESVSSRFRNAGVIELAILLRDFSCSLITMHRLGW